MKRYPAIEFAARYGRLVAWIITALCLVGTIICAVQGGSALAITIGLLTTLGVFALLRVGAEMIEVIADTLLPK